MLVSFDDDVISLTFSVCQVVRFSNVDVQTLLLKKHKVISKLIDRYQTEDKSDAACNGSVLQCLNIIRLQAEASDPTSFIPTFLRSHASWRQFLPTLCSETLAQQRYGLGIIVPTHLGETPTDTPAASIDHGSDYAKGLGFVDDIAWPEESALTGTVVLS